MIGSFVVVCRFFVRPLPAQTTLNTFLDIDNQRNELERSGRRRSCGRRRCKADTNFRTDSFSITTTGNKPGYFAGDTAIEDFPKQRSQGQHLQWMLPWKITITIPKDLINKTGVLFSIVAKSRKMKTKRIQEQHESLVTKSKVKLLLWLKVNASVAKHQCKRWC